MYNNLLKSLFGVLVGMTISISTIAQTITWTGGTDTDWHKTCNWDLNVIPTCTHDVVIPNVTNDPIIAGIAHCNTIDIQTSTGALLTINSSASGKLEVTTCPTAATDNGGCCAPPVAPTATAASGITKSIITGGEFTANWNAVGGATSYRLDISLSSTFASFVVNNLNVGNVTSHTKTGLDCSVTYYYRVRAFNGCASSNSNTITVVMTSCNVCAQQACEFTFGYGEWQCMCNACSCP